MLNANIIHILTINNINSDEWNYHWFIFLCKRNSEISVFFIFDIEIFRLNRNKWKANIFFPLHIFLRQIKEKACVMYIGRCKLVDAFFLFLRLLSCGINSHQCHTVLKRRLVIKRPTNCTASEYYKWIDWY